MSTLLPLGTPRLPLYDRKVLETEISGANISGEFLPLTTSRLKLFTCAYIDEYYYDTLFYHHIYTSLYIALEQLNKDINYDIIKFSNLFNALQISFATDVSGYMCKKISYSQNGENALAAGNYATFTFDHNSFKTNYANVSGAGYKSVGGTDFISNDILSKYKPVVDNIATFASSSIDNAGYLLYTAPDFPRVFNKSFFTETIINLMIDGGVASNLTYDSNARQIKLYYILYGIFNTPAENIMGYLLFYKIYYSLILYNLTIQIQYRNRYINNNAIDFTVVGDANIASLRTSLATITNNLNTDIVNMTSNIESLRTTNLTTTTSDYLRDKFTYKNKIANINAVKDNYITIQQDLNRMIKEYNDSIRTYNMIKLYATIVIAILIILVIGIIVMSIMPIVTADTKNMVFIIALIIIVVITYLYYDNFKYVNLYEPFANSIINNVVCAGDSASIPKINASITSQKEDYATVPNNLVTAIAEYNAKSRGLINQLQSNLNIVGNKIFSETGNIYLNDMYIQKRELIKANKLQQSRLYEIIYVTKKDITFIFNIILLMLLFIIILLSAMVAYATAPQYFTQIIILCVILSVVLLTYFIVAVVQPTRRDYSKFYWGNFKPSSEVMGNL